MEKRTGNSRHTLAPHVQLKLFAELYSLLDPLDPRDMYLKQEILSKYVKPSKQNATERQNAAINKWLSVEDRNGRTNMRVQLEESFLIGSYSIHDILDRAATYIRRVIGDEVPREELNGSFSGGASTSLRRQPGVVALKYVEKLDVTQEAWDAIWPLLIKEHGLWHTLNEAVFEPRFVDSNIMFTVPKNSRIDRVCCKEPDLNMFVQKGCGDIIRARLRKVGVNLNDQSRNRNLAREGSLTGELATIDLSSASDTVSDQLVMRLVPHDWYFFLDALRCKQTLLPDGTTHVNNMFSSMGNGFTFELESLIFWGLVKAVCYLYGYRGRVSVYGDDIICPSGAYKVVRQLFSWCGFKLNDDKSFCEGPFRESCGGHYHSGIDITPFYVKEPITSATRLIHFLNKLRNWCAANGTSSWCDTRFWNLWQRYASLIDNKLHGGWDCDSIETLASRKGQARRLVRVRKVLSRESFDRGLYLQWMSDAARRRIATDSVQSVVIEEDRFVVRQRSFQHHHFGLEPPLFSGELLEHV